MMRDAASQQLGGLVEEQVYPRTVQYGVRRAEARVKINMEEEKKNDRDCARLCCSYSF